MQTLDVKVTELLREIRDGREGAEEELVQSVLPVLKSIARNRMGSERKDHTLQATALVNEVFLRVFRKGPVDWRDRAHFFKVVGKQMRCVLVDHGRRIGSDKRGNGWKVSLDEKIAAAASDETSYDGEVIHELLERLQRTDAEAAEVIGLKFFAGLTDREVAEVMRVTLATVRKHWVFGRAWLRQELSSGDSNRGVRTAGRGV